MEFDHCRNLVCYLNIKPQPGKKIAVCQLNSYVIENEICDTSFQGQTEVSMNIPAEKRPEVVSVRVGTTFFVFVFSRKKKFPPKKRQKY